MAQTRKHRVKRQTRRNVKKKPTRKRRVKPQHRRRNITSKRGGWSISSKLKKMFTRKKKQTPCEQNTERLKSLRREASDYTTENGFDSKSVLYRNQIATLKRLTKHC